MVEEAVYRIQKYANKYNPLVIMLRFKRLRKKMIENYSYFAHSQEVLDAYLEQTIPPTEFQRSIRDELSSILEEYPTANEQQKANFYTRIEQAGRNDLLPTPVIEQIKQDLPQLVTAYWEARPRAIVRSKHEITFG